MCAITGSFDTEKLKELVELNSYRGQLSHSISYYNCIYKTLTVQKNLGPINLDSINIPEGHYGICHTQAPTTDALNEASIHPAEGTLGTENKTYLWHNGILKAEAIKKLQVEYHTDEKWDTALLLRRVMSVGLPNNIDGTFSCLWFKPNGVYDQGDLYLFRNELAPMFIDDFLNISSTKFEGSYSTDPNKLLYMDIEFEVLHNHGGFETVESPYFFWD